MKELNPRPGILSILPYVPGKSDLPSFEKVIKLSSNESALGPSPKAIEAFNKASVSLHRYPEGSSAKLRGTLGKYHGLDENRITCGAGSDEILYNLARAYAGPGDEIIMSKHGFNMYPIIARTVGAIPVIAPERELTFDVDSVLQLVTRKTKILFIANPNNPTGSYISGEELFRLRAGLPKNVLLVIDCAYAEYVIRNDYSVGFDLVDTNDNTVITRTFSKIYGLAALRIGWAYCPPSICDVLNKIRGPFNLSTAAQEAGIAAVEDEIHVAASRDHNSVWLPWLSNRLKSLGLTVYPSVANFVLVQFPETESKNCLLAMNFFNQKGIIPRETSVYHLPACLRVTIGTEDEIYSFSSVCEQFLSG